MANKIISINIRCNNKRDLSKTITIRLIKHDC